ncbi:MAG: peptidoglycan editing factor PgeF [Bacillota bacterium]|nr:peptidoglycan editing factor PgeF [Bacillota bacterium]
MRDCWQVNVYGNTKICQDYLFKDNKEVVQAFSTRLGGVSQHYYSSLNMGLHVGDDPNEVIRNRKIFSDYLEIPVEDWVTLNQIHSDKVVKVTARHKGKGSLDLKTVIAEADAMITDAVGSPLVTFYADCIPVYIFDPVQKAIGLAHAGWRGAYSGIALKTIMNMQQEYGSRVSNLLISIGPGIGQCCYQVDEHIYSVTNEKYPNYLKKILIPDEKNKWLLNLKLLLWLQLTDAGIKEKNISVSSFCTQCHHDVFFSYRGDQGKTGRMAALFMLKENL